MPTAIITGAGSGIGRATAFRLAKSGHAVALVGRTRGPLEKAAADIEAGGAKALAIPTDVTQLDQVESMIHRAMEAFGRIDVLVNNAGFAPAVPLAQLAPQQWHQILDTNLSSAFYTTRSVWPIMQRQHRETASSGRGGGIIINISSMASRNPFPGLGAYGAAKVGLNMLTLATAREGHEVGIRAVCIAPGAVDTPMFREFMGNQPIPEGMALRPEDVAAMIAEAVSGSLRFTSGETLFIHSGPA